MLIEIAAKAPIPIVDACACCLATGLEAGLVRVRCTAPPPEERRALGGVRLTGVTLPLSLCSACRTRLRRSANIALYGSMASLAIAAIGFLLGGALTGFLCLIASFFVVVGIPLASTNRWGQKHRHAAYCRPLSSGFTVSAIGGPKQLETYHRVAFANEAFARLLCAASAQLRLVGTWSSIGILFDIDALIRIGNAASLQDDSSLAAHDGTSPLAEYGHQARILFMERFDPEVVGEAFVFHGDTSSTLSGRSRLWCIAVATQSLAAIQWILEAFSASDLLGLPPISERFLHHLRDVAWEVDRSARPFGPEPLPAWFSVDDEGSIALADRECQEDIDLCARFRRSLRLETLGPIAASTGGHH